MQPAPRPPECTTDDPADRLRADLLLEQPEAIERASQAAALDFLSAAISFARHWRDQDDPLAGIRALTGAALLAKEADRLLKLDVTERHQQANYWRQSRDAIDHAAAIFDALSCGRPRCQCQRRQMAHCPAHQDEHPSLSISVKGDKVLMRCFSGCSQQAVIGALQGMGLWAAPRGGVR